MQNTATHTLYGTKGSGSASTEMGLRACGLGYKLVHASSWEPQSAQAALARANPLRQIPTLVLPDGTVLSESAAILIHLGLAHPHARLLPQPESARASALRGLVFIAANCYSAISISDYPERWTTSVDKDEHDAIRKATRRQLHAHWNMFADMFQARPYLAGDEPGALDFLAVVVSKWSGTRPHLEAERPGFFAALKRIEAHDRVAPVMMEHWDT